MTSGLPSRWLRGSAATKTSWSTRRTRSRLEKISALCSLQAEATASEASRRQHFERKRLVESRRRVGDFRMHVVGRLRCRTALFAPHGAERSRLQRNSGELEAGTTSGPVRARQMVGDL